jgi:hypothetical protein
MTTRQEIAQFAYDCMAKSYDGARLAPEMFVAVMSIDKIDGRDRDDRFSRLRRRGACSDQRDMPPMRRAPRP